MQALKAIFKLTVALKAHKRAFIFSVTILASSQLLLSASSVLSVWYAAQLNFSQGDFSNVLIIIFGLSIAYSLTKLIDAWISHEIAYKIIHTLRSQIFSALERIAPFGFEGKHTAELASSTMADAEQLEWFYAHTAATALCAFFVPLTLIGCLFSLIGPISLLMLIPLIIGVIIPLILVEKKHTLGLERRTLLVKLKSYSLDALEGQRELRTLDMNNTINQEIQTISNQAQSCQKSIDGIRIIESGAGKLLTQITVALLLITLTGRVLGGTMSAQLLACSIVLAGTCVAPAMALTTMIGRFGDIGACAQRINEILAAEDKITNHHHNLASLSPNLNEPGTLSAANVDFQYNENEATILEDLNLTINHGQAVALVGKTGAGKSTFANLVLRFLDPTTGSIKWRDTNLTNLDPDEYRSSLALVPQSGYIFHSSVRDNLLIAKEDATNEELNNALDAALASSFISKIGGLDAKLGHGGAGLSGGERQRLAIARAFLRNPQLLVLDEPLANLDGATEDQIAHNIRQLRKNKTTIIIAHRLKSIAIAEQIALLENGHIEQQGTHEELLKNSNYFKFFKTQL